jgi:hypothetical protein
MKRFAFALALLLLACSDEPRPKAEPAPPEAHAPTPAPAPAPSVEQRDPTPEELPIAEDFEEQSLQQITEDNFKAELDTIEKELDAEK